MWWIGFVANNRKFIADVSRFADKTADQMLLVARQSIDDVVRIAQTPVAKGGNMPVDTGFLRNSLAVEINGVERAKGDGDAGKESNTSLDAVNFGLSNMALGDSASFVWASDYAIPRHYLVGVGQGGGLWRDKAAQQWGRIVAKNARRVR
jgi:hypothetical protein